MLKNRKIINLFDDSSISTIKYLIFLSNEEDLNQLWNFFIDHDHNDALQYITEFLYAFIVKQFKKQDSLSFNIIVEESDKKIYITLWDKRISNALKKVLEKYDFNYKHHKNKITIKVKKGIITSSNNEPIKEIETAKEIIIDTKLTHLRYTNYDKVSAKDYYATLDTNIIDKLEDFLHSLDDFVTIIYQLEKSNSMESFLFIEKIVDHINRLITITHSLTSFPIITKSFVDFSSFLTTIDPSLLEDLSKIHFLSNSLLLLEKDLSNWIKTMFIDCNVNNIHYFDSSFASCCLEIEATFKGTILESNEDTLEFF